MRFLLVPFILIGASWTYADQGALPGCPTEHVPDWKKDSLPRVDDQWDKYKACDHANLPYKVLKALSFIASFEDKFPGYTDKLGPGFPTMKNPMRYFLDQIDLIRISIGLDSCNNEVTPYFHPDAPRTLTVCRAAAKLYTLALAEVLIHEARHNEGYGHVHSTHGELKNISTDGCDTSLEEGGS